MSLLNDLLGIPKVEVKAVCDIVPGPRRHGPGPGEKRRRQAARGLHEGRAALRGAGARDDLDLVYIPTPWRWHVRMAVAAMEAGKHAMVEVPAARDPRGVLEARRGLRAHAPPLHDARELPTTATTRCWSNRMVKAGLFGELLHAECAYNHDLRKILFENASEGLWRRAEHIGRNGNLYPTHGLGPVAWYLGIHKGDRFDHMVSMSSPEAGLTAHRKATVPAGDPKWQEKYDCGDVEHEPHQDREGPHHRAPARRVEPAALRPHQPASPAPRGSSATIPPRIFFDGAGGRRAKWAEPQGVEGALRGPALDEAQEGGEQGRPRGHGLRDELAPHRLRARGAACRTWTSTTPRPGAPPAPLSESSVAAGSAPVKFPDFMRGRWKAVSSRFEASTEARRVQE